MADDAPAKPDLKAGVAFDAIPEGGILAGEVDGKAVLLTLHGAEIRAFGGECTHLGARLADGIVVDGEIRCPWHHACFDLRTGRATAAPGFDALPSWTVERRGDRVFVTQEAARETARIPSPAIDETGLVIVGGGAAGYAAAHEARALGYQGPITMISADDAPPYDRTLLTKDYLDGSFGADRLPIARTRLSDLAVTLLADTAVVGIDPTAKTVRLGDGKTVPYTKLLLATGAEPNRLDVPGADLPHVHPLRSLADCQAILDMLEPGLRVAVIGSSFIGLEAAASLRSRDFAVTVITPDKAPMAKLLGPELAEAIVGVHRAKGVTILTERSVDRITSQAVELSDGSSVPADLVVVGIGVTPRIELAEQAGLAVEDGVIVDGRLASSDPDIFAAGDIARWPDPHSGHSIRVEHWVVAGRQGQVAMRNMLGGSELYTAVPFFWSKHFDFSCRYLGHADNWDEITIDGDLGERSAIVRYRRQGRDLAVATVERDREALEIERAMETSIRDRLDHRTMILVR